MGYYAEGKGRGPGPGCGGTRTLIGLLLCLPESSALHPWVERRPGTHLVQNIPIPDKAWHLRIIPVELIGDYAFKRNSMKELISEWMRQ